MNTGLSSRYVRTTCAISAAPGFAGSGEEGGAGSRARKRGVLEHQLSDGQRHISSYSSASSRLLHQPSRGPGRHPPGSLVGVQPR